MKLDDALSRLPREIRDGVLITTADPVPGVGHQILWCNEAVTRDTGYTRDELVGHTPRIFHAPDTCRTTLDRIKRNLAQWQAMRAVVKNRRKDGEPYWVDLSLFPVADDSGRYHYWIGVQRDVTEIHRLKERLGRAQESEVAAHQRMRDAIEALPEAFSIYDSDDRLVMCNARYRDLYAHSNQSMKVGESFENILRAGLAAGQYPDAEGREEEWLTARLDRHRNPSGPIDQKLPDDRHLRIHEVRVPNGDTVGFRVDVTEIKRYQRALEHAAETDPLTELYNRRGIERAMAASQAPNHGVLHIDLDRFKPINDVFGHPAGDFLLRHVSDILRQTVRPNDLVGRVGGDEFLVAIEGPCTIAQCEEVARRLIEAFACPVSWENKRLHFGASIGISLAGGQDMEPALRAADIALYEAKGKGRNRHFVFNDDLRARIESRKRLSDELLVGLERGEVVALYQPQIRADDGGLAGVEALARWNHPERGILAPDAFIGLAEDLGVLAEVDRLVFEHAIQTGKIAPERGCTIPKVSVNVSMQRLAQDTALGWLPKTCDLPFRFAIELLEAIDVDRDFDTLEWMFDALRERGIALELDDFGSGRASLTSLVKIRPDRIKLDQQIVRAAQSDSLGAAAMARAISEMCRGMQIPMTAEGVETATHAQQMRALGCDILQGYHIGKPMSRETLFTWSTPIHRQAG